VPRSTRPPSPSADGPVHRMARIMSNPTMAAIGPDPPVGPRPSGP
jgi:hypothetical protein